MALREIIADLNLTTEVTAKLAFFSPLIGIPFMVVSWFMLLRFSFNLNGYQFSKGFIFTYFPTFVVIVFTLTLLIQKEILKIPSEADLFIIRIIVLLNLFVHLFFMIPFLIPKKGATLLKETGFSKKWAFFYFLGILVYSFTLFFFKQFGFISTCISILLLFLASVFIPVKIRYNFYQMENTPSTSNLDFESFCKIFEISKREAEIILEICSGKSNKAIADKLFITLQTVKDHNHRIYTKTGVKSRVQLANLVREKTGMAEF